MVTDEALHPASLSARVSYSNSITRWHFSGRRRPQQSPSDLQQENKRRRESQMRQCGIHSVLQKAANFPPLHRFSPINTNSSGSLHLQPIMGQQLAPGAWPSLTTPIFHTFVERGQLLSGLLLDCLIAVVGEPFYKHKIAHSYQLSHLTLPL